MSVLPWRRSFLAVGAYAGRARFRPSDRAVVTPTLQRAIGQIIEVGFAGIAAPGAMFAGQALYLEWRSDQVLDGFLIPEQDLEFLDRGRFVPRTLSFPAAGSPSMRSGNGGAA